MSMHRATEPSWVVGKRCLLWPACSLDPNSVSFRPASFCTPRPKLPIIPGATWFPTFAFQSPMINRTSFFFFFGIILESLVGINSNFFDISSWGSDLNNYDVEWFALETNQEHAVIFWGCTQITTFWTLLLTRRASPFLLRDSYPQ